MILFFLLHFQMNHHHHVNENSTRLNLSKERNPPESGHLLIWRKKIPLDHLQYLFKVCFLLFVKAFLFISQSSVIYPIDHVSNSLIFIQISRYFLLYSFLSSLLRKTKYDKSNNINYWCI